MDEDEGLAQAGGTSSAEAFEAFLSSSSSSSSTSGIAPVSGTATASASATGASASTGTGTGSGSGIGSLRSLQLCGLSRLTAAALDAFVPAIRALERLVVTRCPAAFSSHAHASIHDDDDEEDDEEEEGSGQGGAASSSSSSRGGKKKSKRHQRVDEGNTALLKLVVRAGDTGVTGSHTLQYVDVSSNGGVGDLVLHALARHSFDSLRYLDVSRCRGISNTGLGEVADSCPHLCKLRVWGCTQLTEVFFHGHARSDAAASASASGASSGAAASSSSSSASSSSSLFSLGNVSTGSLSIDAGITGTGSGSGTGSGLVPVLASPIGDVVQVGEQPVAPLRIYGRPGDVFPAPDYD